MHEITRLGIRFSVDDFGTGYLVLLSLSIADGAGVGLDEGINVFAWADAEQAQE